MNPENCVCCGPSWKERKPTSYTTGAKSIPFTYTMSLIKNRKGERVKLTFCELHGNNHMAYTKTINGKLYITNVKTHKRRLASRLGVAA